MGAFIFFLIASAYLGLCAFGIKMVLNQNMIIFSFANTLDDRQDLNSTGRGLNELFNANDTNEFNDAVLQCLQKQNELGNIEQIFWTFRNIWVESIAICVIYTTSSICYPGLILQTSLSFIDNESWF